MDTCESARPYGMTAQYFQAVTSHIIKIGLISAYSEAIMEHGEFFRPLVLFHRLQF